MEKKKILICGFPNSVLRIFIENLKDQYTIFFISYSKKLQYQEIKKILGNNVFLLESEAPNMLTKLGMLPRLCSLFFRIATRNNIHLFIAYHNHFIKNGVLMILAKWCSPHTTRIHFPYDISIYAFPKELRYRCVIKKEHIHPIDLMHSWLSFFFERMCFEKSDKIITKGFKDELLYLKAVYKIHGKPHFVFNYLIEQKNLVNKEIKKPKEDALHLVFIGGISNSQTGDNNYHVFAELLKEESIVLHVYSHTGHVLHPLRHLKNLLIHEYIADPTKLIKEISTYDFGITLSAPSPYDFMQLKMASGARLYDYLAAGLPIIIDSEHVAMARMVSSENNFGIVIPLTDVRRIREYVQKWNYESLLSSVKKNREKFIAETQVASVVAFIEQ